MTQNALTPRERRLRRGLVALAMVCAALVLVVIVVLVYWRLYLLEPSGDPFTRGPFVTRLGTTGATLAWSIDGGRRVELTATGPDGTVTATRGSFTGLEPGTRYLWTASVGGVGRAAGSFRTAPIDLSDGVRFAVIGDYGSGNDHEWAVGRTLAAARPDFVTTVGDNSYLVGAPQLLDRNIFEPLHDVMLDAPLWATEGEHDLIYSGGAAVTSALHLPGPRGRYVVRYGPLQLVLLGLEAGADELAFAKRALAEPGALVRFVVVHRPIQPGNPILPVLRRAGVAAIFAGHLHRYERRTVGGLVEFTVGTGGEGPGAAEFTKATPGAAVSRLDYGSLLVDVSGAGIAYTFVDERGRVLDTWSKP
jgi:Calcineurin-like phosphoesterase